MINRLEVSEGVYKLVGVLYEVHRELGPGLNEYIYQEGLKREFELQGIPYQKEVPYHPIYKGQKMESEYRLDFLADDNYIIELKAVSSLTDDHRAQYAFMLTQGRNPRKLCSKVMCYRTLFI